MAKFYSGLWLFMYVASPAIAQTPVIQTVDPLTTFPLNTLTIGGSGFSNNPALLQVWFDQVQGRIIQSTGYSIEVAVPPQARLNNVEVINLSTGLSAKSTLKFMPGFGGTPFDPTKFTAPLSYLSTDELWDLCSCDLNSDSKPEIVSTKFYAPGTDIMILQNQSSPGNLAFTKLDKTNLPSLDLTFPTDNVTCGDLQGDGKPDLVVTRAGSPRNSIHILQNTSTASISFAAPINLFIDIGRFATRSVIRDLNKDGKPEIIVSNSFNNEVFIFVNTSSSGSLSYNPVPIKLIVTGASTTYGIDVQDLNGDDLPEIIINQFQSSDVFILKNSSTGSVSFSSIQKITIGGTLNRMTTADINKDGLLDLILTNTISSQVSIMLNRSNSIGFSFPSTIYLNTSTGPWGVDVSDIDGDGDPDIIVASRNQKFVNVFIHNGSYTLPFFTRMDIPTPKTSRNVRVGDLDGDAKPDIAFTSSDIASSSYSLDILRSLNCHQAQILNDNAIAICSGQTIRLRALPAINVTFVWREGSTVVKSGADAFLDIVSAGTYTVTAIGEGGACNTTSAAITVTGSAGTAPSDPVLNTNSPLCAGSNLELSTDAVAGATYQWTGPNGFISSLQNPIINNVTEANAGIYRLVIAVGTCRSIEVSEQVDVVDVANFAISSSIPTNSICQGSNLVLSVTNSPDNTYQWTKDGSILIGETANALSVTQEGNYNVQITNTLLNCELETEAVYVTVFQAPLAAFSMPAVACTSGEVLFTNQSQVDSRASLQFQWNFGDNTSADAENPAHIYQTAQTFNPALTVNYAGVTGCSSTVSKSIAVSTGINPDILSSVPEICPGEEATLSVGGSFSSISWNTGATSNSINPTQPGDYSVSTTDATGCPGSDTYTLNSKQVPVLSVTADKTAVPKGETVQLNASGADNYEWTPAESLNDPLIADPVASPSITTLYTVTGTLTGECSAQAQITITVDGEKIFITVPPAFSPNGDGVNEMLVIDGITEYQDCVLTIFDGRGRRIYEQKSYNNDWNGTYQGRPVPDGTYFYVFGCPTNERPVTGSVLVFR